MMSHHHHDHAHDHAHEHGRDHSHDSSHHDYKGVAFKRLAWSLGITVVVMFVEVLGGYISQSIALISDAGHMLTHAFAIGISMFAILIARRPACHHRTFGLLRAEILAAFVNGIFLILVSAWIVVESVERFVSPREIMTGQMLMVAILGLVVNIVSIVLLEGSRKGDMNVHSVFMHMIGDAASSVAIVIAALVIGRTNWLWIDPVISILIAVLIVVWAVGLLRDSARVLLEMAPKGRNVHEIIDALRERYPQILRTSNEHVWTITQEVIVFSAHLYLHGKSFDCRKMNAFIEEMKEFLKDEFDVEESTIQVHLEEDD